MTILGDRLLSLDCFSYLFSVKITFLFINNSDINGNSDITNSDIKEVFTLVKLKSDIMLMLPF